MGFLRAPAIGSLYVRRVGFSRDAHQAFVSAWHVTGSRSGWSTYYALQRTADHWIVLYRAPFGPIM
jgi:hypothetical protein